MFKDVAEASQQNAGTIPKSDWLIVRCSKGASPPHPTSSRSIYGSHQIQLGVLILSLCVLGYAPWITRAWGIVKGIPHFDIGGWVLIGVCVLCVAMIVLLGWLWLIH
jgi:peptidoglycan biosynthesis protein MviN/MurJ (putative lipid II flippase)